MRRIVYILVGVCLAAVVYGCKHTPRYVIGQGDMAEILADLYVAEGVIDQNPSVYRTDSAKLLLRQSIMAHHGVTQEDFDTSLVWYGHNMNKYVEVYDKTIKILENRERKMGNVIIENSASISGDSAEVWPWARYARLNRQFPSRMITFDIQADGNWEPGDVYTWRVKLIDKGARTVKWTMLANYADSTCEWISQSTSSSDWNEVVFVTDSTKTMTSLKGFFEVITESLGSTERVAKTPQYDFWIDSISLVRKRANPEYYGQRFRVHHADIL